MNANSSSHLRKILRKIVAVVAFPLAALFAGLAFLVMAALMLGSTDEEE